MEDPFPSPPEDDSDPEIMQDVDGDGNQVIGQVIGAVVTNHITINNRIPAVSLPPSNIVVETLAQQEYRQRQVLLNKVKDYWVKSVLEKSLHARVSIELGLQERPDLVQQPFSDVAEFEPSPGQALPGGTSVTAVFVGEGVGGTLLIVGEPGSGKTIALLKLAEDIIDRTEPDLRQQIPVVFNLSSWAIKPQSIEQWLIRELDEQYGVPKAFGKVWVESEALMLLLDGLDEVKAEQRNACVQALNQFMRNHGTTEIVICCRIDDYQMLQDRLRLRSAVCIQPLTVVQIDRYFEEAGDRLSALKAVLSQDVEIQQLAKSPLMLSVMSLAYQDFTPEQLTVGGKIEDYRKRLFATYIDRMFQRRGMIQQYSREDSQRWLIWLAQGMTAKGQTIFLIEGLQPSCLLNIGQQIFYLLGTGILCGLSLCIVFSVFYELSIGLSTGISYILISCFQREIKTVETFTLKYSWKEVRHDSLYGCLIGSVFAVFSIITNGIYFNTGIIIQVLSLFGMLGGITGAMMGIFRGSEIQDKQNNNEGIIRSEKNAKISFVISFLVLGTFSGLQASSLSIGLTSGLSFGIVMGLIYGGNACVRHFALRVMLYCHRHAPWNYAHFLNYATERLFLQKVGGGYIFVHRMLLEHFAEMSL
jgi:GTPase SAR1 family protein